MVLTGSFHPRPYLLWATVVTPSLPGHPTKVPHISSHEHTQLSPDVCLAILAPINIATFAPSARAHAVKRMSRCAASHKRWATCSWWGQGPNIGVLTNGSFGWAASLRSALSLALKGRQGSLGNQLGWSNQLVGQSERQGLLVLRGPPLVWI